MTNLPFERQQDDSSDERLALPIEQGVLLWCMRMSVIEMKHGISVEARVDDILDVLGVPSASHELKKFMSALNRGCTRMIEVHCICQRRIGGDERALLDVLSLAQAIRPFEGLLVLRGFVTQAGAEAALRSAEAIGTAFAQAGCFLPEPADAVRHYALSAAKCSFMRSADTILH